VALLVEVIVYHMPEGTAEKTQKLQT